ncbi:MAG: glycosyltransferase family 4 protein, partial [Nitrobacter sp.]
MSADNETARDLQLIVANLHWRYSGVTATSRMVTPRLAKMFRTVWFGPDAPDGVTRLRFLGLLKLRRQQTPLIWHARRNNDMMAGVLLK